MRINVYTEELLPTSQGVLTVAEVVTADYISSRTGKKMTNYGVRIYLRSAPELHYVPPRDDDRSAITFWCGEKERYVLEFLDDIRRIAYASTLKIWRDKTNAVQKEAEAAIKK